MTEGYRPLFGPDPVDAGLVDGIPVWIHPAISAWLLQRLTRGGSTPHWRLIEAFEIRHRLQPIDRSRSLANVMVRSALANGEYGLTLINYLLWVGPDFALGSTAPRDLNEILSAGGSVWEVTQSEAERDRFRLTRRDLAGTKDAIAALPANDRAADMLRAAWVKIASRDPDPSGAYDLAVKAVEAAAHPIVSPKHAKATLGSMIGELRANPERWSFVLEDVATVTAMATTLWTHHYRHGTEQRDDHTIEEADTAVHLALALVRFFTGNAITVR